MLHGPKQTQKRAKKLRRAMTLPEVLLWQELKSAPAIYVFAISIRRANMSSISSAPASDWLLK